MVVKANPYQLQLHGLARRRGGKTDRGYSQLLRAGLNYAFGGRRRGDPDRAGSHILQVFFEPVNVAGFIQKPVHHDERIVLVVADQPARRRRRTRDGRGRRIEQTFDFRERTVEAVQNAVEPNAHLHSERPASDVVGRYRRAAGITEIVRVILRLEHIENVRAESLRRLDYVRSSRIVLAVE